MNRSRLSRNSSCQTPTMAFRQVSRPTIIKKSVFYYKMCSSFVLLCVCVAAAVVEFILFTSLVLFLWLYLFCFCVYEKWLVMYFLWLCNVCCTRRGVHSFFFKLIVGRFCLIEFCPRFRLCNWQSVVCRLQSVKGSSSWFRIQHRGSVV